MPMPTPMPSPIPAAILVLNAGSSSIKFALFDCPADEERGDRAAEGPPRRPRRSGEVEGIGETLRMRVDGVDVPIKAGASDGDPYRAALAPVIEWVRTQNDHVQLAAVAHRVVHGGARHTAPVVVNEAVLDDLCTLIPLAPLHQPHNIGAIEILMRALPGVPQVAVFDTTFHRTLPRCEQLLPLPHAMFDEGVRRYGFHGLSYEYLSVALSEAFGAQARGRVVAAHLGSGASLCALQNLQSVATTMGFSALDGLMMSTRCGSIDPGVLLHLIEVRGLSHRALGRLLYDEAGLKGVSGTSGDPRVLLDAERHDERARDALALYVRRIVRETGALVALLGGLDMLVFTAGVGEHSAPVRERVCAALQWLGIELDSDANRANAHVISTPSSRVTVVVEPTNEEWVAAQSAWQLLGDATRPVASVSRDPAA